MAEYTTLTLPAVNSIESAGAVVFTWAELSGATQYELEVLQLDKDGNYKIYHAEKTTALTLTVTLPAGGYLWRVTCTTSAGKYYGEERAFAVRSSVTEEVIADFDITIIDDVSFSFTHTENAIADSYEYSLDNATPVGYAFADLPITLDGLTAETEYTLRVRGVYSWGPGPWATDTDTTDAAA